MQKTIRAAIAATLLMISSLSAQDSTDGVNVSGTWQLTWKGHMGQNRHATFQIKQDSTTLSGTIDNKPMTGSIKGAKISFSFEPMSGMRLGFSGTVDGDNMSGSTSFGHPWSATRQ
jgi:hypothetical protein